MFDFLKTKVIYSFDDGALAMERGDREKARDIWLEVGKSGDARAQYALVVWYTQDAARCVQTHEDASSSVQKSIDWGTKAAHQGHVEAQIWLGECARQNGWLQQQLQAIDKDLQSRVLEPFEDSLWSMQLRQYVSRNLNASDLDSLHCYWAGQYLSRFPTGIKEYWLFVEAVRCAGNGQHEQSIQHLRKVIDLNPEFREACHFLGLSLMATRLDHEAVTAFRRAVAGNRLFGMFTESSWALLGVLYGRLGQKANQRECLEWVEKHAPWLAGHNNC